ncbi:MAG: hypothetical protein IPL38_02415 [Rhodobacter sp.]|nr:hypothetical protein [Rhodobacter sp.]
MVPDQRAEMLQGEARDADKRQCDHRLHRQAAGGPGDGDFLEHRNRAAFVRHPHVEPQEAGDSQAAIAQRGKEALRWPVVGGAVGRACGGGTRGCAKFMIARMKM